MAKWIIMILVIITCPPSSGAQKSPAYEKLFETLIELEPNGNQAAAIESLTLQRDTATFSLASGRLYLCHPINQRVHAAIFLGDGQFSFTPPTLIEQEQLERFYDQKSLREHFNLLFLFFADSTLMELQNQLKFKKDTVPREAKEGVAYALKYLSDKGARFFDATILKTLFNNPENGLFYAHFSEEKIKPLFFQINPYLNEEVQFLRRPKHEHVTYTAEVICQFHQQSDWQENMLENKTEVHITDYRIDAQIKTNLDFSAAVEFDFYTTAPQQWLSFVLFSDLKIEEMKWGDGRPAEFFQHEDNLVVWVQCDPVIASGQTGTLRLKYRGDLIERISDWFNIKAATLWYPRIDNKEKATFDLTFRTPKKYEFVSIGKKNTEGNNGEPIVTHWQLDRPVRNASFNIGHFETHTIASDSLPPVTVLMTKSGHQRIAHEMARMGVGVGKDMEKQVGQDVVKSIDFFLDVYGDCLADHFYVTEIPGGHGEAFPGLVHLSWNTFLNTSFWGDDEIFRAHEIAHQWWGIGVDYATYHDQWLSEGICEYSGLWYLQHSKEDPDEKKMFFKKLKDWRELIINNRQYIFGSGKDTGPIWLGHRNITSESQGDYNVVIYKKGAWVIHMLRAMLQDLETSSDQRFIALMRDFYQSYLGNLATTEEFRHIAENHFDRDMGWFFDQWVYGTDIPTYRYAYRIEAPADSSWQVDFQITVDHVAAEFRMPVLITIEFKNSQPLKIRQEITGHRFEFSIGQLPAKPRRIIFNDAESVLAKVHEVDWETR